MGMVLSIMLAINAVLVGPNSPAAAARAWPAQGQAAYTISGGPVAASPGQHSVPIASVAKVMTAYLVLARYPVVPGQAGFRLRVTAADVADTNMRIARGESYVPVRTGEQLTETQALAALLLPSANNVAIMLARKVSRTVHAFVNLMNSTARRLGMTRTHYTDPSGFDPSTVSTAADQTRLAPQAMHQPMFRLLVRRTAYRIPVAGTVRNKDTLLGHDGFVGIKTGSMSQSGGCFMFLSQRHIRGRNVNMYGVVLGQPGGDLIRAGLAGAQRLVDTVAPHPAT